MKTFVMKNLIWVFALVVGIGTMSFKMVEKSNEDVYWFLVDGDTVTETQMAENQVCINQGPACAISFSRDTNIPTDLGDAQEDPDYLTTAYGTLHTEN